jgi:glucosylceramidase
LFVLCSPLPSFDRIAKDDKINSLEDIMRKGILLVLAVFIVQTASCQDRDEGQGPEARLYVTTESEYFVKKDIFPAGKVKPDLTVDTSIRNQVIEGFGGAFNEQGWVALMTLPDKEREEVLRQVFDPVDGLRFNICRVPIGASDYALDRYSCAETPDDWTMSRFSLARDEKMLIPYILAAMKYRPDLKIWASAWSPPIWMKINGAYEGGAMRDEPSVYQAYALYLARFVEGYRAKGIDLYMVVPQNEPGTLTGYPSCDWKPKQYQDFIRDYLGPLFRDRGVPAEIWLGTFNHPDFTRHVSIVLNDPAAAAFITGVGLQWDGLEQVERTRKDYPEMEIMQTETDCGNWHWKPGFNSSKAPNDFVYAAYTWRKFQAFIGKGCSSYLLWNIVLDEKGKNIDNKLPWPQNSAIVVDRKAGKVIYTPMFWATRHFSALVDTGAVLVASSGKYADAISFVNPDGRIVVELLNDWPKTRKVNVLVSGRVYTCELPPRSFATLVVDSTE